MSPQEPQSGQPTDCRLLLDVLTRRAAAARQPLSGAFELTSRCNLRCGMCYIRPPDDEPAAERTALGLELPAKDWVFLAREAVANGTVFLLLTGGEPFLRSDFFDIYEPVRAMGLSLVLFTNGTLLTREVARRLAARPPNRLEITLYGASQSAYETVTGVPGSYARCLAGIENLRSAGVPFSLKTTLNNHNLAELDAMKAMAREWGVVFAQSWLITPRRDRKQSCFAAYRLQPHQVVALEAAQPQDSAPAPHPPPTTPAAGAFYCHAGTASYVVNAAGEMNVCMDLPRPAARVLECGFRAAWEAVNRVVDSVSPQTSCTGCDLERFCPRCPAFAWLETGDLAAGVPYFCQIAKERREKLP